MAIVVLNDAKLGIFADINKIFVLPRLSSLPPPHTRMRVRHCFVICCYAAARPGDFDTPPSMGADYRVAANTVRPDCIRL